jgi:acetyltransferase-like isoleucine patch superfamily enzyme
MSAAIRPAARSRRRLLLLALVALMPTWVKRRAYSRLFGYQLGDGVRIGVSLIDATACKIGDHVAIGHGNVFLGVASLQIGEHARIGHLNMIRGGDEVNIGRYAEILRLNQMNSIPEPDCVNATDPRLELGPGSVVTASHKIDFTDRVELGARVILGGRNSSLWTHNRQRTAPVTIGPQSYVGSEIRMAPGSSIPPRSIVGIGAVIVDELTCAESLIVGVPAKVVRPLDEEDRFLIERKTRPDLPDDI